MFFYLINLLIHCFSTGALQPDLKKNRKIYYASVCLLNPSG